NPDFAAMARSAGIAGVNVDRAADLSEALRAALASRRPYLINANIGAEKHPGGAGVGELPGLVHSQPAFGARCQCGWRLRGVIAAGWDSNEKHRRGMCCRVVAM